MDIIAGLIGIGIFAGLIWLAIYCARLQAAEVYTRQQERKASITRRLELTPEYQAALKAERDHQIRMQELDIKRQELMKIDVSPNGTYLSAAAFPNLVYLPPAQRQPKPGKDESKDISTSAFPVPSGRELLEQGVVERFLAQGKVILGVGEDGDLKTLLRKRVFSTLVSGLPGVGKTTTVFWIAAQIVIDGGRVWVVDPHMYFEDEEGNKSLAAELTELQTDSLRLKQPDPFVFPTCEGRLQEMQQRMRWMYQQLLIRKQRGYIVRAKDTVLAIMDEYNSIADGIDPDVEFVVHEGQSLNFAQTLALLEREGRKFGLHFLIIGHKWARQDIGGDNAVRTNATTYLCHRMNDEAQANLLLGSGQGKKVLTLLTGAYWITGPTWNAPPAQIHTPMIAAPDIPVILLVRGKLARREAAAYAGKSDQARYYGGFSGYREVDTEPREVVDSTSAKEKRYYREATTGELKSEVSSLEIRTSDDSVVDGKSYRFSEAERPVVVALYKETGSIDKVLRRMERGARYQADASRILREEGLL